MISPQFSAPLDFSAVISRISQEIENNRDEALTALATMLLVTRFSPDKIFDITRSLFGAEAADQIYRIISERADHPDGAWKWLEKAERTIEVDPRRVFELMVPNHESLAASNGKS